MPEAHPKTASRREIAAAAVGGWITEYPCVRPLVPEEIRAYSSRNMREGWRLDVQFADRTRHLDLLLPDGFPRLPPRIALVDRPKFLTWPHIDEDGVLCLLGDHAEIDFTRPIEVASTLLSSAAELVGELTSTGRSEDFRAEFNTYWNRTVTPRRPKVYSLLSTVQQSRMVAVWRGRAFSLIGDQSEIDAWLMNRFKSGVDTKVEAAAVVWLPQPLLPSEFPSKPDHVFRIAHQVNAGHLLEQMVCQEKGEVVIFAAPTPNGPCFAAVTLAAGRRYGQRALTPDGPIPGFRPGKAPRSILVNRIYSEGAALKSEVERADATWVHGRGQDPRFEQLRNSTVAVLGCGSVGAPTAIQLAGAGVGGLILIDPETLRWANVTKNSFSILVAAWLTWTETT
jgi:sulfur-carrier protein adenylyltransferase/sulfurtransferase